jgi:hypothetical protein
VKKNIKIGLFFFRTKNFFFFFLTCSHIRVRTNNFHFMRRGPRSIELTLRTYTMNFQDMGEKTELGD